MGDRMKIKDYLMQTEKLFNEGQPTDGCTLVFDLGRVIHKIFKKSKLLCAAHDFGGLGLITGVKAGWNNNWHTWLAHFYAAPFNPIYWIWGTIVSLWTLPWVVYKHNYGGTAFGNDSVGFSVIQAMGIALFFLIKYQPV